MKTRLNQASALWDLGISDLIEEVPGTTEHQLAQFTTLKEEGSSNVYLMRPKPSWKTEGNKSPHFTW